MHFSNLDCHQTRVILQYFLFSSKFMFIPGIKESIKMELLYVHMGRHKIQIIHPKEKKNFWKRAPIRRGIPHVLFPKQSILHVGRVDGKCQWYYSHCANTFLLVSFCRSSCRDFYGGRPTYIKTLSGIDRKTLRCLQGLGAEKLKQ